MSARPAVMIRGLTKTYGRVRAVDGLDLSIEPGEVVGVLGPNGAGKTTTLECLAGLRVPDSGTVEVFGRDPRRDRDEIRRIVAVQPQQVQLLPSLTVRETLRLWSSFYPAPRVPEEIVELVGLAESAHVRVGRLSGGQQRRLVIGAALVGAPRLVILDEPSAGLDPQATLELWEVITAFRDDGGTAVLATHAMAEAESLCDRVAIIDRGRVSATGGPAELTAEHAPYDIVSFAHDRRRPPPEAADLPGTVNVETWGNRVRIATVRPEEVRARLLELEVPVRDLSVRSAGLEEVFRRLTGHSYEHREALSHAPSSTG